MSKSPNVVLSLICAFIAPSILSSCTDPTMPSTIEVPPTITAQETVYETEQPTLTDPESTESEHIPTASTSRADSTYESSIAISFSIDGNFLLSRCRDQGVSGKIMVVFPESENKFLVLDEPSIAAYYPAWHPTEPILAYIQIDYSNSAEDFQNSEIIRRFQGDSVRIMDIRTGVSEAIGNEMERTESLTPSRSVCNARDRMTRLLGWSPNGEMIHYRFYGNGLLGEQFALLNVGTGQTTILARDMGNFDWIGKGEQIVALNVRERVFGLFDSSTGNLVKTLPLPPTSPEEWLPLIEWSEAVGTFIADAPASTSYGTSFWTWSAESGEWIEVVTIPADYPVQTWDTHSEITYICSSGEDGAQLILLSTGAFSLINKIDLPADVLCRTMERTMDRYGVETLYFLLGDNSIFMLTFGEGEVTERKIDLSQYTDEFLDPNSDEVVEIAPFWMDVYP